MLSKIIKTVAIVATAGIIHATFAPASYLVSNASTIAQMDNTDQSSYTAREIGNGGGLLDIGIFLISAVGTFLIWRRKK